ncbi:collagen-like protein [Thalassotalea crassostreae]|uniref:collagen-like protein n=1 Tax=Thalassotalea crassostreae TaxID=1763536 RepID=UPI000838903E|nr:collagen-like protein [Thalassotalea crassostreae]
MKSKILTILITSFTLFACDGDNGSTGTAGASGEQGPQGVMGEQGVQGESGINCWDLNLNRVNEADEDVNKDGAWNAFDCTANVTSSQTSEVMYSHQQFCEAFANLGQYPEGCPSDTHTMPTGTITEMNSAQFFEDEMGNYNSCSASPEDGLLTIKHRESTNADGTPSRQAWFEVKGAYIAKEQIVSIFDEINSSACKTICENDSKCVAANASKSTDEAFSCRIFYHSDTVDKYEKICGVDTDFANAAELCILSLGGSQRWASMCQ